MTDRAFDEKLRKFNADEMQVAEEQGGNIPLLIAYAHEKDWDVRGSGLLYKIFAEKYHWTPEQTRTLSDEEIHDLLVDDVL